MAIRVGLLQSSAAATTKPRYGAHEFARLETNLFNEGVVQGVGGAFAVTQFSGGANMSVDVAAGLALIEITNTLPSSPKTYKVWFENDATVTKAITTADPTNPRKDRIILKVDVSINPNSSASNIGTIDVLAGTPSGSPSAPAEPANSITLAIIDIPASDTTISTAQITDSRSYITIPGTRLLDLARSTETAALRADSPTWLGTVTGTNTITASATPAPTAYAAGQRFAGIVANTNSGAVTININSLGAKDLFGPNGAALIAGELVAGWIFEARYDGTRFIMTSPKFQTTSGAGKIIHLQAPILRPTSTNGCGALIDGTGVSGIRFAVLPFDATIEENAYCWFRLPDDYTGGTIKYRVHWYGGAVGNVMWGMSVSTLNDGDDVNAVTEGTRVTVTDAGGVNLYRKTDQSGALTISNSPSAGDLCCLEITRVAANAADTMTGDAYLMSVELDYT